MGLDVYKQLLKVMQERGDFYSGLDIPEFYEIVETLFHPDEAEVNNALTRQFLKASDVAKKLKRNETELSKILENMANKGLCVSSNNGGVQYYQGSRFVSGIFDYQFMKGENTKRDKKVAKLIRAYKEAYDTIKGPVKLTFLYTRVITVNSQLPPLKGMA